MSALNKTKSYNMKGMADVLNMYGSSLNQLEIEHQELVKKYHSINLTQPDSSRLLRYKNKIKDVRRKIKSTLENVKYSSSNAILAITKKKPEPENKKEVENLLVKESDADESEESEESEYSEKESDKVLIKKERKRLPSISTVSSSNSTTELSSSI